MIELRKAARIVGRARDCDCCSLAKAMLQFEENELWSHREFCASGGECALSPLKWPRGELRARCRELNCASHRHSQFWG